MNKLLAIIATSIFLILTPLSFVLEQTVNGQVSNILNNETNNL
ncbi:hypothetical protein [Spiroplasma mirum]|nr:hypothetical protein [Spiroplasma atrichopogonis]AKM52722.1 hypothetical protein SATRI_v1c01530 [Spiroplasma atrichopogonis]